MGIGERKAGEVVNRDGWEVRKGPREMRVVGAVEKVDGWAG